MKILYVGGTGEISHACVAAGAAAGQDVTVFNRGRSGEPLPQGVKRIAGEINDSAYEGLGKRGFDVVCQFLAYEPGQIERDLEVFGGRVGQYVFISTASAYQKPPPADAGAITERTPLANPYWPYSQTKADMETALFRWHGAGRLPVTVVRPSHTYRRRFPGTFVSGDDHVWRMRNGLPVVIHDDGTAAWTYTHASDFARAFVRLLGNPGAVGEAFHITRPDATTWNDIFRGVARALGIGRPSFVHVPTETLVRYDAEWAGPLLGDKAWRTRFDLTKLKSVVGEFTCEVSMERGLAEVAAHYARRGAAFVPDERVHALIDRVVRERGAPAGA